MKTKIFYVLFSLLLFPKIASYGQNQYDYFGEPPVFESKEIVSHNLNRSMTENIEIPFIDDKPNKANAVVNHDWGNIPIGPPIQAPIADYYPVWLVLVGIYFLFILKKRSPSVEKAIKDK